MSRLTAVDPLPGSEPTSTSPRRNRVDPWGDLHSVDARGMFTGNRGCLVADDGVPVRHHNGSLWIICRTRFRDWRHPLAAPRTWTPLFFLDDAVALAAGHRPCGLCRRDDYLAYRAGVSTAMQADRPVLAHELNRRLTAERLDRSVGRRRGRGLSRAGDRLTWRDRLDRLPAGTVVLIGENRHPHLVTDHHLQPFDFQRWGDPLPSTGPTAAGSEDEREVEVLTPPTSVDAIRNGFRPILHATAVCTSITATAETALATRTETAETAPEVTQ